MNPIQIAKRIVPTLILWTFSMVCCCQSELVYSRSIASKETLMNQGAMACDSLGNVWIAALRSSEVKLPDLKCDEPLYKRVTLISKLNAKGEFIASIELMAYTGARPNNNNNAYWWGMPLLRCDKQNRLWVIGGIGCEVHMNEGGKKKVIDCADKNVAVFDSKGKFYSPRLSTTMNTAFHSSLPTPDLITKAIYTRFILIQLSATNTTAAKSRRVIKVSTLSRPY